MHAFITLIVIVMVFLLMMSGLASTTVRLKDKIRDFAEKLHTITTKYNEVVVAKSNPVVSTVGLWR